MGCDEARPRRAHPDGGWQRSRSEEAPRLRSTLSDLDISGSSVD